MNSISLIIKIIEEPTQQFLGYNNNLTVTEIIGKYVARRNRDYINTVKIKVWGNLGSQIKQHYNIGDYILVEGFINIKNEKSRTTPNLNVEIVAKRIYPFLLDSQKNKENSSLLF